MQRLAMALAVLLSTVLVTPTLGQVNEMLKGLDDPPTGSIPRTHKYVPCSLSIKDVGTYSGNDCDVSREGSGPTTIIRVGDAWLKIERSLDDNTEATMYRRDDDGEWTRIGVAIAQGNCWTGSRVRFCAD